MSQKQIFIQELAQEINRRPHTIRCWERYGVLPKKLRSKRTDRGWRYWSEDQLEGIKAWMISDDRRPGKGLPHYNPTEEELDAYLEKVRKPRLPKAA